MFSSRSWRPTEGQNQLKIIYFKSKKYVGFLLQLRARKIRTWQVRLVLVIHFRTVLLTDKEYLSTVKTLQRKQIFKNTIFQGEQIFSTKNFLYTIVIIFVAKRKYHYQYRGSYAKTLERVLISHSISVLKWALTSTYKCVLKCPPTSVWNQHTIMCLHLNTQWGHLKHMQNYLWRSSFSSKTHDEV